MSPSVLIVDDVQDWREMLAGLISEVYPRVTVASVASADQAREQLESRQFDLAVIDIRLDELDEDNVDGLFLWNSFESVIGRCK